MTQKETILVFTAHNDDQIIGAGGTLAKYAQEGKDIIVYIFSFGELSHPHFKKEEIIKTRVKEMHQSDKILKIKESFFLDIKEGVFREDFAKKKRKESIIRALEKYQPAKIFTHARDDPHPDHKAVHEIIKAIITEVGYKGEVYTFDVWNPFSIRERNLPKLVVDISETMLLKGKALRIHESQVITLLTMLPSIYTRAIINGLTYGFMYAEKFTKLK